MPKTVKVEFSSTVKTVYDNSKSRQRFCLQKICVNKNPTCRNIFFVPLADKSRQYSRGNRGEDLLLRKFSVGASDSLFKVKPLKSKQEVKIMPRRGNVPKRDVLPDPVYNSKVVTKLVNQIMYDGKRGTAQTIVYDAFKIASEKLGQDPMDVFNQAMNNIMPVLEVKARRVGGANYQVPMEIRPERRQTLAIRWLVIATRKRSERDMSAKLAAELMDAYNNAGGAVKKKEDTHRMAEANKAFAHFRF